MNTTTNNPQLARARRMICQCALFIACAGFSLTARAQTAGEGMVAGTVSNSKTGVTLEGADVSLVGVNGATSSALSTITERGGTFLLNHVPPGSYTVHVTYTGLDEFTAPVTVAAGQTVTANAGLTSQVYQLEAYAVEGQREGNAAAITQQKNAPNIVDVLSMDAYGDVADGNIGIMIQNEPGVDVFQQSGDDSAISVGGVPTDFTSVNIDGARMGSAMVGSSAGTGDRSQFIDRVPADFISRIEVTMGSMPNEMADSLGGSVNLITKSGFDVAENILEYRFGVTNNNYFDTVRHRFRPTGELSYLGTIDKNRKIAVSLNASYSDTLNPNEDTNGSHSNINDARPTQARMLNDLNERRRDGLNGKIEYKFDNDTARVFFSATIDYYAFINQRTNWQASASNQNFADYSVVSLAAIEAGTAPKTSVAAGGTAGGAAGLAPGFDPNRQGMLLDPNVTNDAEHEDRRGHQYTLAGGFDKTWGDSKLTFQSSWNPTSFDDDFYGLTVNYNNLPVGMLIDETKEPMRPVYTQTYGPSLTNGQVNYTTPGWYAQWFKQPDIERQDVSDTRADFEQKGSIAGLANVLTLGSEYMDEHNWRINTYRPFWNYTGSVQNMMSQIVDAPPGIGTVFNNAMPTFQWDSINFNRAKALFLQYPQYFVPSGTTVENPPVPNIIAEDVSAAYAMDSIQVGNLNILGGIRFEHTAIQGSGSQPGTTIPVHVAGHYNFNYPSLHLKYDVNKHLVFKASYSTTGARPDYSNIVPNTTVNTTAQANGTPGSVTQSNPATLPMYTRAFEGAAEYYFEPAGLLSFSYFYREISNFIINESSIIGSGPNNGFGGQYAGYTLNTTGNLDQGYDEGYEIDYKQQFRWLPKPFNGISLFADTTIQKTHGTFLAGATALPFFVPETSNIGVIYDWGKFEGRFTWHDHSYFLQSFSTNPAAETWVGDDPQEDVSFTYAISPHLTIYIDGVNIRDKDFINYAVNIQTRNTTIQDSGRRFNLGISGRF